MIIKKPFTYSITTSKLFGFYRKLLADGCFQYINHTPSLNFTTRFSLFTPFCLFVIIYIPGWLSDWFNSSNICTEHFIYCYFSFITVILLLKFGVLFFIYNHIFIYFSFITVILVFKSATHVANVTFVLFITVRTHIYFILFSFSFITVFPYLYMCYISIYNR